MSEMNLCRRRDYEEIIESSQYLVRGRTTNYGWVVTTGKSVRENLLAHFPYEDVFRLPATWQWRRPIERIEEHAS